MAGSRTNLCTSLWLLYLMTSCFSKEPHCSRFPYDEALLEKLVRLEFKVEQMDSGIRVIQDNVLEELNKLKKEREDNMVFRKQLEKEMTENFNKTVAQVLKQAESVIEELQTNMLTFREDFKDLTVAQNRSPDKLQELADASKILFRARNVSDLTPSKDDTMVFTNVMTNQGRGYNSANGVFNASIAGLYLFTAQFCNYLNNYFRFAFYVDGVQVQATAIGSSKYNCITSVMPIELRKSSEVSVKCILFGARLYADRYRWNIFSGVLIRPLTND